MKLEQQVCSLELSKRLKELGVRADCMFWWENHITSGVYYIQHSKKNNRHQFPDIYAAYTASELLEEMPLVNGCPFELLKGYLITDTQPSYCGRFDNLPLHYSCMESLVDRNPSNAIAKMLIHLIETGAHKP